MRSCSMLQNGLEHFALCSHSVLTDTVSIELQRGPYVRVPEQRLHGLRVRLCSHEEGCEMFGYT